MGEPDTTVVNRGQQIFLEKFFISSCFVDKITYFINEMSKFVNGFMLCIIGEPD